MRFAKAASVVTAVLALEAIARPGGPTFHGSFSSRTIRHASHYSEELEGPSIGDVIVPKPEAERVEAHSGAFDKHSRLGRRSFSVRSRSERHGRARTESGRSNVGKRRHIYAYVEVKGGGKGPPVAKAYYETSGTKKPPVVKVRYDYNSGGKTPSISNSKQKVGSGSDVYKGTIKIRPMSMPPPPPPTPMPPPPSSIPQQPTLITLRPMPMQQPSPLQAPGSTRSTRSQGYKSETFKAPSLNEYQRGYQRGLTRGYGEGWYYPEGRFPF